MWLSRWCFPEKDLIKIKWLQTWKIQNVVHEFYLTSSAHPLPLPALTCSTSHRDIHPLRRRHLQRSPAFSPSLWVVLKRRCDAAHTVSKSIFLISRVEKISVSHATRQRWEACGRVRMHLPSTCKTSHAPWNACVFWTEPLCHGLAKGRYGGI